MTESVVQSQAVEQKTATQGGRVRSLIIPVRSKSANEMIIPNALVAEIVGYQTTQTDEDAPGWLLGMMPWRGRQLPLISIANAIDERQQESADGHGQVLVLHGLSSRKTLDYYGVYSGGIPHLLQADQSSVTTVPQGVKSPLVLTQVLVEDREAFIPDLDLLESMLVSQLGA